MSIYVDAPKTTGKDAADLIGVYATELSSVDTLVKMGYTSSNSVNLTTRANELIEKITQLERQIIYEKSRARSNRT